jgi:hypothetical protein
MSGKKMDSQKSASHVISVVVHHVNDDVSSKDAIVLTLKDGIIHVPAPVVIVDNHQAEVLYNAILLLRNYKG